MEMQEIEPIPYDQFQRWLPDLPPNYMMQMLGDPIDGVSLIYPHKSADDLVASPLRLDDKPRKGPIAPEIYYDTNIEQLNNKDIKKAFALTPLDSGYFEEIAASQKTSKFILYLSIIFIICQFLKYVINERFKDHYV